MRCFTRYAEDQNGLSGGNSYLTYNILDEEMEGYLKLVKVDAETGKAVKLANTAFAIFMLHEDGTKERLSMVDPSSGDPTEKTNVFYTDSEGRMKTPEKLPLGRYEVVELEGPNGFFNDEAYTVQFPFPSDHQEIQAFLLESWMMLPTHEREQLCGELPLVLSRFHAGCFQILSAIQGV